MTTQSQAPKVLAFARVANEISKRHQDRLEKDAADSVAVQVAATGAVDALVAHDRIFAHQKEAVAEKIASFDGGHLAAVELIRDLAKHRNATEIATIGSPVGEEKTASARTTGAPVADFDNTESGRAFRDSLCGAGA